MKTNPKPRFIFQAWAYGGGLQVGAQYALEDGHITPLRAKIDNALGSVIQFLCGWWWWS